MRIALINILFLFSFQLFAQLKLPPEVHIRAGENSKVLTSVNGVSMWMNPTQVLGLSAISGGYRVEIANLGGFYDILEGENMMIEKDGNQLTFNASSGISSVSWGDIQSKPSSFASSWSTLSSKPTINFTGGNVTGSLNLNTGVLTATAPEGGGGASSWNELTGKPTSFPSTWATVSGKPTVFPTRWDLVAQRPNIPFSGGNIIGFLNLSTGVLTGNGTQVLGLSSITGGYRVEFGNDGGFFDLLAGNNLEIEKVNNQLTFNASDGGTSDGNGIYDSNGTVNGRTITVGSSGLRFFQNGTVSFENGRVRGTSTSEFFAINQSSVTTPDETTKGIDFVGYRGTTSALMNNNKVIVRGETELYIAPPNQEDAPTGSVMTKQADGQAKWEELPVQEEVEIINYSTAEQLINSTWADSEALYQKTFLVSSIADGATNNFLFSKDYRVKKQEWGFTRGTTKWRGSGNINVSFTDALQTAYIYQTTATSASLTVRNNTGFTISNIEVTVWYTK